MKLSSLKEMGTGQVVRKEIQCAFSFVWMIMFSSMLMNIVLFLLNKSSASNYCPNALLKLHFWPLFGICYFCCHLLIAVLWSFYFFPTVLQHPSCPHAVPWSLHCLPAVLGSCGILPLDLLALVAPWPQKAASTVNHATFPVLLLLRQ